MCGGNSRGVDVGGAGVISPARMQQTCSAVKTGRALDGTKVVDCCSGQVPGFAVARALWWFGSAGV